MNVPTIEKVIVILKKETRKLNVPIVTLIAKTKRDPFKVLTSCLLSLRTNDYTTVGATKRLFTIATTPREILKIPLKKLEKIIYPVGFYRVKAKVLHSVSKDIIERFKGKVPADLDELLTLKGVGRKTANLVLTLGYQKHGICVDIHVHRISNRFGFVETKNPEETEFALRDKLPKKYWIQYNDLLVAYGQHICRPVSPKCSSCKVRKYCERVGVKTSR